MNAKLISQVAIGVVGFGLWTGVAFTREAYFGAYMTFVISSVTFIAGWALRDLKAPNETPPETTINSVKEG